MTYNVPYFEHKTTLKETNKNNCLVYVLPYGWMGQNCYFQNSVSFENSIEKSLKTFFNYNKVKNKN